MSAMRVYPQLLWSPRNGLDRLVREPVSWSHWRGTGWDVHARSTEHLAHRRDDRGPNEGEQDRESYFGAISDLYFAISASCCFKSSSCAAFALLNSINARLAAACCSVIACVYSSLAR